MHHKEAADMIWHICRPLVSPLPASQGGPPKPSPESALSTAELRFFALLVQRPISPRTSCPTITGRLQWSTRRSSDRKRAQTTPQWVKRLVCSRYCRGAGLGFSNGLWREPPENWVVGCETSRGTKFNSRCQPLAFHSLRRYIPRSSSL